MILSFGAVAIIITLSNVLEARVFGETRFLAAVLAIFAFFSLPGIGPVMLQRMPIYSRERFKRGLATQFRWGVGATCGASLFAGAYYFQGNEELALAFLVSGIFAPVANLYLMPGIVCAGLKRFKEKTLYDGFIITSAVLGTAYGAVSTGSVVGTMFWYFGAQSLVTCIALYLVLRQLPNATITESNTIADTQYGKQLTLFQIPFALLPALEKVLVFSLLGPVALALYVIALLPVEHVRSAYRSLLQFFSLPHLQSKDDSPGVFWYLTKMAFLLSFGSITVVVLFAYFLLPFFFPSYADVQRLIVFSAMILIALPAEMYVLSLLSDRRIEYLFLYAFATILIDILTFASLTSLFELHGAVAAKVLTSFIGAGIAFFLYRLNSKRSGV